MTKIFVVSDFNAELVSRYLAADRSAPACEASTAPYGQVFQVLAADAPGGKDTAAFIWTRPEGVISEYLGLLEGEKADIEGLLAGVDAFAASIKNFSGKCKLVLVASWVPSHSGRGLGMLDWSEDGEAYCLARMNARLAEALADAKGVFMLDSQRWLNSARPARDAKSWHFLKSPFTETVCQAAARDIKAALRGAAGLARKLVIVDLDDTLWGGVVAEEGWQAIRLGGHDAVGEAYREFQRALRTLARRGIAIAVVSKNDEAVALDAIENHPEMLLRRADLAGWRINWGDKAQNVIEIARELNLGLQSVVFIDDNPAERGRVREALPDVLVPEWPKDPARYAEALRELNCFDQAALTDEDRSRTRMYAQSRERSDSLTVASSMKEWFESLDVCVNVEPIGNTNIKRTVQLLNKTNQMNLRTRRMTEAEMLKWLGETKDRSAMTLTIADRFGDVGLTGVVSWQRSGDVIEIIDYVLSCRAMGRQVEELMAHLAVAAAENANGKFAIAQLVPTERNRPCLEFWKRSGFTETEPNVFTWDVTRPYPKPHFITLESKAAVPKKSPVGNLRAAGP